MKSLILACLIALPAAHASAESLNSFADIREGDMVTLRAGYAFDEIHLDIGRSHLFGRNCYSRIAYAPKGLWQSFKYGIIGPADPGPITLEKETHWKVVHREETAFAAESLEDSEKPRILIRCEGKAHLNGTISPLDFGKDVTVPAGDAMEQMAADGITITRDAQ